MNEAETGFGVIPHPKECSCGECRIAELEAKHTALVDGVKKFLNGDYQQAERPGTCKHGRYWYEQCVLCIWDHFNELLGDEDG